MTEPAPAPAPTTEPSPAPPATQPPPPAPRGRYLRCNLIAIGVALLGLVPALLAPPLTGTPSRASSSAGASSFADARWDDGQAELCRYDAERVIYGKPRAFELIQVVVKEPFDPRTRTKPDAPRPGVVEAIKLVRVEDAPSGRLYRYRQTLTLRVERSDPWRLLSAECGSQEWCGNTFALVSPRSGSLVKHVHSYFFGEGDREETFPRETLLEDQLNVLLRAAPRPPGERRTVSLLGSIVANKHPVAQPASATIATEADETVATGVGPLLCAHVKVEREALPVLEYWVAREAPHLLARWKHGDGRQGTLRSAERTVYWRDP